MKRITRIEQSVTTVKTDPAQWNSEVLFCGDDFTAGNEDVLSALFQILVPQVHRFTQEQLQHEFNYLQAARVTLELLNRGHITGDEYKRIMSENKRTFPTFLAAIL
jgi:hypothetical protein